MIRIAHRGNVEGPSKWANHPDHINAALAAGYHVEVDIWHVDGIWYYGHDKPQYRVNMPYSFEERFWLHCKNIHAVSELFKTNANFFWHQSDDLVITSHNYAWVHPNKPIPKDCGIAVKPDLFPDWDIEDAIGICSDNIGLYK